MNRRKQSLQAGILLTIGCLMLCMLFPLGSVRAEETGTEMYDEEIREMLLRAYYGRELTPLEHRHAMGQSILNAFYWISWGLFKGSVGEEDGFFFLTSFRYILDHADEVIESYKEL